MLKAGEISWRLKRDGIRWMKQLWIRTNKQHLELSHKHFQDGECLIELKEMEDVFFITEHGMKIRYEQFDDWYKLDLRSQDLSKDLTLSVFFNEGGLK